MKYESKEFVTWHTSVLHDIRRPSSHSSLQSRKVLQRAFRSGYLGRREVGFSGYGAMRKTMPSCLSGCLLLSTSTAVQGLRRVPARAKLTGHRIRAVAFKGSFMVGGWSGGAGLRILACMSTLNETTAISCVDSMAVMAVKWRSGNPGPASNCATRNPEVACSTKHMPYALSADLS